jgi:hypothetical protein
MRKVALFLAATSLLSFLAFNITPTLAHEELVSGNISIVVGWQNEPPLVNQLNGILLIITNASNDQPINNAVAQLEVTLQKGTETKPLEFQPSEEAGTYIATVLPTQTGQYAIVTQGTVAGQAIDGQIQIEDVEDTARIAFPPSSTSAAAATTTTGGNQIPQGLVDQIQVGYADLAAQVEEANSAAQAANNATQGITDSIEELGISVDRTYLFSLIGVGIGVAGIAIGVVALSRREKIP